MSSNPSEHLGGDSLQTSLVLTKDQGWLMKDLVKTTSALNEELAQRSAAARIVEADLQCQIMQFSAIDDALAAQNLAITSAADALSMSAIADRHALGFGLSAYAKDMLSCHNMADYAALQLGYAAADVWAKQGTYLRDVLAGTLGVPDFHTLADALSISALTNSYHLNVHVRPLEVETRRRILCALDNVAAGHRCE